MDLDDSVVLSLESVGKRQPFVFRSTDFAQRDVLQVISASSATNGKVVDKRADEETPLAALKITFLINGVQKEAIEVQKTGLGIVRTEAEQMVRETGR